MMERHESSETASYLIDEALSSGATHLDLSGLQITRLPERLWLLAKQLTHLELSDCEELSSLYGIEQLPGLTHLNVTGCNALTNLAGLERLDSLTSLGIGDLSALTNLHGIADLNNLTELFIMNCRSITSLSGIAALASLTELQVIGCSALQSLAGVEQLARLSTLRVEDCQALQSITGLEALPSLTKLQINGCDGLWSLVGLGSLVSLTDLSVTDCKMLRSLEGIERLTALTKLDLSRCKSLDSLAGVEPLIELTELNLSFNRSLSNLHGIETLSVLRKLNLNGCKALSTLAGIEALYLLTKLDISGCDQLGSLAGIEKLGYLSELLVRHSPLPTTLQIVGSLPTLTKLDLSGCKRLHSLQGIENLKKLTTLRLRGCLALKNLSGIDSLKLLKHLDVRQTSVNDIEPLKNLITTSTSLTVLYLRKTPLEIKYNFQFYTNENSLSALKAFFDQQGADDILLPAKVLFLGNHAVGKSTLVSRLENKICYTGSTHILQVHHYGSIQQTAADLSGLELPAAVFYDFGGQDYYHGVYRIFMGQRSVRCLLWKKASDSNHSALDSNNLPNLYFNRQYWLGCLAHYDRDFIPDAAMDTGIYNPLLLVQTHVDNGLHEPTLLHCQKTEDEQPLRQLCWQHHLSLADANNAQTHERAQALQISSDVLNAAAFTHFKAQLDYLIKQQQIKMNQAAWYGEFLQFILKAHQNDQFACTPIAELLPRYKGDPESQLQNLEATLVQLHRQGLVLYYPQIDNTKVWLNPMAFAAHVHEKLLAKERLTGMNGQIPQQKFEQDIDPDILQILQKEKVVFLHKFGGDGRNTPEYIVPNYLPLTNPQSADYQLYTFAFAAQPALTLWFEQFLPLGLINQLVCHFGNLPVHKKFWRDQILFTLAASNGAGASLVLIKLEFGERLQLKIFLQNHDVAQKQRHISYLYYVLLALYHDHPNPKPLNDFIVSFEAFKRQYRAVEPAENEQADLIQNSDATMLADEEVSSLEPDEQNQAVATDELFAKIYQEAPADLRLSLDGEYFVLASDLAKSANKALLNTVHLYNSEDKQHIETSLFAPFMLQKPKKRLKVFISYAHEDLVYRQKLQQCLGPLVRANKIELWHDSMIDAGTHWDQEIKTKLESADIAVVLISPALLASQYVNDKEMPALLARHEKQQIEIVPVVLEACMHERWDGNHLQFLPDFGRLEEPQSVGTSNQAGLKPLEEWPYPAQAWKQIGEAIQKVCDSN